MRLESGKNGRLARGRGGSGGGGKRGGVRVIRRVDPLRGRFA